MRNPSIPLGVRRLEAQAPLYVERIIEKARVSLKRFDEGFDEGTANVEEIEGKKTHWANRTGEYKDEEQMRAPKFWKGKKPVIDKNIFDTHLDLRDALSAIASGEKQYNHYHSQHFRLTGIDRERLRLAQSWHDRGIFYTPANIIQLGMDDIKKGFL